MINRIVGILFICLVILFGLAISADKTPYNIAYFGNIYGTSGGVSGFFTNDAYRKWLTDRTDMVLNDGLDGYSFLNNLRTGDTSLPIIWVGPYASTQEINMLESSDNTLSYAARLQDTASHWQYIYAKIYLDSMGISPESLVVHIADSYIGLNQDGDGSRAYSLSGLNHSEKRFTYQYWNNTSGDTAFYPAGYVWLANGWHVNTPEAIADAYHKAFVQFNGVYNNWPAEPWDCFYADNQGYWAAGVFLAAYWDFCTDQYWYGEGNNIWDCDSSVCPNGNGIECDSITTDYATAGGSYTDSLEWLETGSLAAIRANTGGYTPDWADYFTGSTLAIDSAVTNRLPDTILGFGNVIMNGINTGLVIQALDGVTFESPIDYGKNWGIWSGWFDAVDTVVANASKYGFIEYRGDIMLSESGWLSDTARVLSLGYGFYLLIQDNTMFYGPHEIHQGDFGGDRRCWGNILEVNFGIADANRIEIDNDGDSRWYKRFYGDSSGLIVMRTGFSTADYSGRTDSIKIIFPANYFEVDWWGDTSEVEVDSCWLQPYEAKFFIQGDQPPVLTNLTTDTMLYNVADSVWFSIVEAYNICSLFVSINDSVLEATWLDTIASTAVDTVWNYTPICDDVGSVEIIIAVKDDSSHLTVDTFYTIVALTNAVLPTATAIPAVDTVNYLDTLLFSIVGSNTYVSDFCSLSIDGGVTYSILVGTHGSEPTPKQFIWTPDSSATSTNCKIKIGITSTDVICGNKLFTTESNIFEYRWIDTTIGWFGSSDTTNSSLNMGTHAYQSWTPWPLPETTEGIIKLDSGTVFADPYYGAGFGDTLHLAIRKDVSGVPGDLVAVSDSALTDGSGTEVEELIVNFAGETLDSGATYWIGTVALPEGGFRVRYSDTTGVTSHLIYTVPEWPLPSTYPGADATGAYDIHAPIFYHIEEVANEPTVNISVIKKKKASQQ